jgi:hypothetical protein
VCEAPSLMCMEGEVMCMEGEIMAVLSRSCENWWELVSIVAVISTTTHSSGTRNVFTSYDIIT